MSCLYRQLHNAHQLAEWCMSYLCVNYNVICKFSLKGLKALHQDNQEYLREHRWPPVWYLKDYDYYQRCINELNKELKLKSSRRDFPSDDEGCLCFTGGKYFHHSSLTHAYVYTSDTPFTQGDPI